MLQTRDENGGRLSREEIQVQALLLTPLSPSWRWISPPYCRTQPFICWNFPPEPPLLCSPVECEYLIEFDMTTSDYLYLHGFASSPQSTKAQYLRERFFQSQIPLKILDLNQGDFSHLTLTRQLKQVLAELPPAQTPVTIIGSSFGGLTAAWLGQQHSQVQRLVLLAPAFGFLSHWRSSLGEVQIKQWQESGSLSVYHYGEKRSLPLDYQFLVDLSQYQEQRLQQPVPTLILHGRYDDVIPIQSTRDYSSERPWVKLIELESDHTLTNVMPEIWQAIQEFCRLRP